MRVLFWMRSALFTLFVFPVLTIFCSLFGTIILLVTGNRKIFEWLAQFWAFATLKCLNVHLVVHGKSHIPKGGCLFLFNHSSFMDIFAMVSLIEKIKFGAKIELFKIPIFGMAMRTYGVLPIMRSHREKAIKVLQDAEERARRGEKFALAPEGKRNTHGSLLQFKAGPFIFAINSGVPIVPVIIKGASEAWPKSALIPCSKKWKHVIHVTYLEPIPTAHYHIDQRRDLAEKTRNVMLEHI